MEEEERVQAHASATGATTATTVEHTANLQNLLAIQAGIRALAAQQAAMNLPQHGGTLGGTCDDEAEEAVHRQPGTQGALGQGRDSGHFSGGSDATGRMAPEPSPAAAAPAPEPTRLQKFTAHLCCCCTPARCRGGGASR